jgi:hypothetical protein
MSNFAFTQTSNLLTKSRKYVEKHISQSDKYNNIFSQIQHFNNMCNHFAHNNEELQKGNLTTDWQFKRADFINGDFITKTEDFLQEIVNLLNPPQ